MEFCKCNNGGGGGGAQICIFKIVQIRYISFTEMIKLIKFLWNPQQNLNMCTSCKEKSYDIVFMFWFVVSVMIYRRTPTYVDPDLRKKTSCAPTTTTTTTTPTPASASVKYDSDSSIDY
jgi:hypothetical protein